MRVLLVVVLAFAACAAATKVAPTGASSQRVTPGEAKAQANEDVDPCEERRRYGDGVCDEFCPEVDPDCDPRVALISPRR